MDKIENEIWKDVVGFEGAYQVSSFGRVKSLDRIVKRPPKGDLPLKGKYIKPLMEKKGYFAVGLINHSIKHQRKIHRLVATMFIDNPMNYPQVNHKDGNKTNNNIDNLEWCNNSMNIQHAYDNGLKKARNSENNLSAKLTNEQVINIRKWYSEGIYTKRQLSDIMNVTFTSISGIVRFKSWKYV